MTYECEQLSKSARKTRLTLQHVYAERNITEQILSTNRIEYAQHRLLIYMSTHSSLITLIIQHVVALEVGHFQSKSQQLTFMNNGS